jgi:hypothetical protein
MRCDRIAMPDGGVMIVCSRGQRRPKPMLCESPTCRGKVAAYLCDHPVMVRGRRSTCGRRICRRCRHDGPGSLDYCPAHGRQLGLFG